MAAAVSAASHRRRGPLRSPAWGSHRLIPALMLLATLGGLALRLARWDFQPLWWDEGYSGLVRDAPAGPDDGPHRQGHPPAPILCAAPRLDADPRRRPPRRSGCFQSSAGVLAVPTLYLAGKRTFGRNVGLLAALLLAVNPFHVFYSQEVRMYGLVALLSAATLGAAWGALEGLDRTRDHLRQGWRTNEIQRRGGGINRLRGQRERPAEASTPGWRASVLYVVLATAALYTQYYAAFLPLGLTLYGLWRFRRAAQGAARVDSGASRGGAALPSMAAVRHTQARPVRQPEGRAGRRPPAGAHPIPRHGTWRRTSPGTSKGRWHPTGPWRCCSSYRSPGAGGWRIVRSG